MTRSGQIRHILTSSSSIYYDARSLFRDNIKNNDQNTSQPSPLLMMIDEKNVYVHIYTSKVTPFTTKSEERHIDRDAKL